MRIRLKTDSRNINLWLPTRVVFGRWVVYLANTVGRRYAPEQMNAISPEALEALFVQMRNIKARYGEWELVDIKSSTGEVVKIIL